MVSTPGRLLEREHELERIAALLERAGGGDGGLVVVEGPAGIGKTRLARAARQEAEARGFLPLAARGTELESEYPFGVVRQLFEPLLRDASASERDSLLAGAAALATPAVLPEVTLGRDRPDPTFGVLHGLYWLCANLADEHPVLVVVDDLDWADQASRRFLSFLVHRLEAIPMVVLVTRRTGIEHAEVGEDAAAERLPLKPLTRGGVAAFLRVYTDSPVDHDFTVACSEATGGNPFLLSQVVQLFVERSVPFTSEHAAEIEEIGPEAVSSAVASRISHLGPREREFAHAAAVLGDDTQLIVAADLAGMDESSAAAAAAALTSAGFLEDARPLRFQHPLVRSAVEASLSAGERVDLHRRAAELLGARGSTSDEVAIHLLATDPGGRPWVVDTLADATEHALGRGAPDAAVRFLSRALAEPPAEDARWRLLLELGRAEGVLGEPQAEQHLEEARQQAPDPVERARCALALAWWSQRAHTAGRLPIITIVEEAIDAAQHVDREVALELESLRAMILAIDTTRALEARGHLERFARLEGRTPGECALLAQLAGVRMEAGAPVSDVAKLAERAVADDDLVARVGIDGPWLMSAILTFRQSEQFETAIRALDHALAAARRRGAAMSFALASSLRASILLLRGDVREAEADARAGLDASSPGMWSWLPCLAMLVEALVERDALLEAHDLLVAYNADDNLPDVRAATTLRISRAALWAARGEHDRTLADLELARSRLDHYGTENVVGLDGRLRAALARNALGDYDAALCETDVALNLARHWGTPGAIGTALRARALVIGGDEGVAMHEEAAAVLEQSARRLEHARALVDLGAALRRQGPRAAAREPLRRGMALTSDCGGLAVVERAHEELKATGVRVRRDTVSGVDSLTPSERRIVERAAAGMSNRQIAQSLFVTVKTVEMHLGHAYRKLDISSRSELAPLLSKEESEVQGVTS